MAVSQPKMVRFSFCKKGFEGKFVLYHLRIQQGAVLLGGRFYWGEYGNMDLHSLHTVGFYEPCQNLFVTKVAHT